MLPLFKPLFRYRKYLLAGKLLNYTASNYVAIIELDERLPKKHIDGKLRLTLSGFESCYPKYSKDQIKQAANILHQNSHVIKYNSDDFYQIMISCTDLGRVANSDGYYTTAALKSAVAFFITIATAIGGVALLLANLKAVLHLISG